MSLSLKVSIFFIWLSCHRDCLIIMFPVFFFSLQVRSDKIEFWGFEWEFYVFFVVVEFRIFKIQEFT